MRKVITVTFLFFYGALASCTNVSSGQSVLSGLSEETNELFLSTVIEDVADKGGAELVFQFFDNASFTGSPVFSRTANVDLTGLTGDVEQSFNFIELTEGSYFIRVFLDENGNSSLDSTELSGNSGSTAIEVEETSRSGTTVNL